MTTIYIPKTFNVASTTLGSTAQVHEAISSNMTYKTLEVAAAGGTVNVSPSGYICALLHDTQLSNSVKSATSNKYTAFRSNAVTDTAALTGAGYIVHLAPCDAYHMPSLPAETFQIPHLNPKTTYSNNISGRGEFIGRSVVRRGESVSIKPMSFACPVSRLAELKQLKDDLQRGLFYVEVKVPDGGAVIMCGWTSDDPSINYIGDMTQVELSFSMEIVS